MTAGCPGCEGRSGLLVASAECAAAALVLAEREFSDPAYFAVHRLTVAAYMLQHPDVSSEHAVAVHLGALRGAVELGLDSEANGKRVRWLAGELRRNPPGRLARPADRGVITVTDVVAAGSADEHCAVVRRWAAAVLAAWTAANPAAAAPGSRTP